MVQWIRYYFADDDVEAFHELDEEGWSLRQVELQGPDRRPVTAARLDEVLHIRDHDDLAAMQAYERKYGVLSDASLAGWQEISAIVEITAADFELVWLRARAAVEHSAD